MQEQSRHICKDKGRKAGRRACKEQEQEHLQTLEQKSLLLPVKYLKQLKNAIF